MRNECKGMQDEVAALTLQDVSPAGRVSGKALGFVMWARFFKI